MRRVFLIALMVCLLIAPARALEVADRPIEDDAQNPHVVVATLDELQEAIAAANDGDTIEITQKIKVVNEYISTDKDITIACADDFEGSAMFDIVGSSITGLSFKGGGVYQIFAVVDFCEQETIIQDCIFDGDSTIY